MDIEKSTSLRQKADPMLHATSQTPPRPPSQRAAAATTPAATTTLMPTMIITPPSPSLPTTTTPVAASPDPHSDASPTSHPTGIPARKRSITYEESSELQLKRMGASFIKQRDSLPGGLPPPNAGANTNDPYAAYSHRTGKFYGFPGPRRGSRVALGNTGDAKHGNNSSASSSSPNAAGASPTLGGNARRANARGSQRVVGLQEQPTESSTNFSSAQRAPPALNGPSLVAGTSTSMNRGGVVSVRALAPEAESAFGASVTWEPDTTRYEGPPPPRTTVTEQELTRNPTRRRLQQILDKVHLADSMVNGEGTNASATHTSRAGDVSRTAGRLPVRTAEERQRQLLEMEKAKLLLFVGRKFNVEKRIEEVMALMDFSAAANKDGASTAAHSKARREMEERLQGINRTLFSDPFFTSTRMSGGYTSSVNSQDDFNVAALRRVIANLESELQTSQGKVAPGAEEAAKAQEQQLRYNTFSNFKDMCWLIESLDDVFASDGSKMDLPDVVDISPAVPENTATTPQPTTTSRDVRLKSKASSVHRERQASPSLVQDSDPHATTSVDAGETIDLAPNPFFITETHAAMTVRPSIASHVTTTRPSASGVWTPPEASVVPFSLLLSEQEVGHSDAGSTAEVAKRTREDRLAQHPEMNLLDFMWDAAPTAEEAEEAAAAAAAASGRTGGSRPYSSKYTRSRPVSGSRSGMNYGAGASASGPHRLGHFAEAEDDGLDGIYWMEDDDEGHQDAGEAKKRKQSTKSTASGADGIGGASTGAWSMSAANSSTGPGGQPKRPRSNMGARATSAASAKAPARPTQNVLNLRADLLQDLKKLYNLYNYDKLIEQRRDSTNRQREAENAQQIAEMQARLQEKMNHQKDHKRDDTARKDSFEGLEMMGRANAPSRVGERPKSTATTKTEEDPPLEAKDEGPAAAAATAAPEDGDTEKTAPAGAADVTNGSLASHSPSPLLEEQIAREEEAQERRELLSGLAELVDFDIDDEEMDLFVRRIPGQRVVLEQKLEGGLTFILSGVLKKKEREREQAEAEAAAVAAAAGGKGEAAPPPTKPKKGKGAAAKKKAAAPLCPYQFYILRVVNTDHENTHMAQVTITNKNLKNLKTFVMPGVQRKSGLCYLYPVQPRHARVFLRLDPVKSNKATSFEGGLSFREAEEEDMSKFKTFDVLQQVGCGSDDDSWAIDSNSGNSLHSGAAAEAEAAAAAGAATGIPSSTQRPPAAVSPVKEDRGASLAERSATEIGKQPATAAAKPAKGGKGKSAPKAKEKKEAAKAADKTSSKKQAQSPKAAAAEESHKLPSIKSPAGKEEAAPPSAAAGPSSPSLSGPAGVSAIVPTVNPNASLPSLPPVQLATEEERKAAEAANPLLTTAILEGTDDAPKTEEEAGAGGEEQEEGELPMVTDVLTDTARLPEEWGQARPDTVEEAMENNLIVLSALQMQGGEPAPPEGEEEEQDENEDGGDGVAKKTKKEGGEEGGETADAARSPSPAEEGALPTPAPTAEESEAALAKQKDDEALQAALDDVLDQIALPPPQATAAGSPRKEGQEEAAAPHQGDATPLPEGIEFSSHDAQTPEKIAAILVQGIEDAMNGSSSEGVPAPGTGGEAAASATSQGHGSLSMGEGSRPPSAALGAQFAAPLNAEETAAAQRLLSVVEEHSMFSLSKAHMSYGWLPPPTIVVTSSSSRPLQTVEDVQKYGLVAGVVVDLQDYSHPSVRSGANSASSPSVSRVPASEAKRGSSAPFVSHLTASDSDTTRRPEESIYSSKSASVVFDVAEARTDMAAWVNQQVHVPEIIRSKVTGGGHMAIFVPPELQQEQRLLAQAGKGRKAGGREGAGGASTKGATGTGATGDHKTKLPAPVARAEALMRHVMKESMDNTNHKGSVDPDGTGYFKGNTAGRTDMEVLEYQARELYMQDPLRYDAVIDDMMKKVAVLLTSQETALKSTASSKTNNASTNNTHANARPSVKPNSVQFGATTDGGRDAHEQGGHQHMKSGFSSIIPQGSGGATAAATDSAANSPTKRDTTRQNSTASHLPARRADTLRISRVALDAPKARGRVGDGEDEIQRILYEQMKAKLVLEAVIHKMQALWARKQRLTNERDKERTRHAYARTMEVTWQFERRRVVNLSKLINMLDRKVGRQRGTWIPYYNDNNILEDAHHLHYRETQRRWYTTAPGRYQGAYPSPNTVTYKSFVPMQTVLLGGNTRSPTTTNVNVNLNTMSSSSASPYYSQSWQSYHVPPPPALMQTPGQQRIYHAMALARRRKLLPLHLVRWEAQQEWNHHLLFGYKRQVVPALQQQTQLQQQRQQQQVLHRTTMTFAGPEAKKQSGGGLNPKKSKTVLLSSPAAAVQYGHASGAGLRGGHPKGADRLPPRRALRQTAPAATFASAAAAAASPPSTSTSTSTTTTAVAGAATATATASTKPTSFQQKDKTV